MSKDGSNPVSVEESVTNSSEEPRIKAVKHHLKPSEKDRIMREVSSYLLRCNEEIVAAYCHGSFLADAFADIDFGLLLYTVPGEPVTYEMSLENELEKLI